LLCCCFQFTQFVPVVAEAVVVNAAAVSLSVVTVTDGVDEYDVDVWLDGELAVRMSGTTIPAATIAASKRLMRTIMTVNVVMLPPAAGPATGAPPGHLNTVHTISAEVYR